MWEQVRAHEDEVPQTNTAYLIKPEEVSDQDPQWNYGTPGGILARDLLTTGLLASLHKAAPKPVCYEKLQEVIWDKYENVSQFLEHCTKAVL